jgi:hypothetical protein
MIVLTPALIVAIVCIVVVVVLIVVLLLVKNITFVHFIFQFFLLIFRLGVYVEHVIDVVDCSDEQHLQETRR